ncbi:MULTISPECIES: hypothetical protein [Sphingobium]|uniref:hypothetical protein n=1 Tax=Sphingobium sp. MI1205 TaxID=407020 RepID=UPI0007844E33|nr:hypothetical protein [Sphingobium sp. MI1205]
MRVIASTAMRAEARRNKSIKRRLFRPRLAVDTIASSTLVGMMAVRPFLTVVSETQLAVPNFDELGGTKKQRL